MGILYLILFFVSLIVQESVSEDLVLGEPHWKLQTQQQNIQTEKKQNKRKTHTSPREDLCDYRTFISTTDNDKSKREISVSDAI